MITLKTTTDKINRETTVSAYDSKGNHLASETWIGTGARVAVALAAHVRTSAEQYQRRLNIASATSATQARQLENRL